MQATFFSILLHYKGTAEPPEQEMVKAEPNNGNNINNIIRIEILSNYNKVNLSLSDIQDCATW